MPTYDVFWTRTAHGVKQIHAANKQQAEELFYAQNSMIEQVSGDTMELTVRAKGSPETVAPEQIVVPEAAGNDALGQPKTVGRPRKVINV